MTLHCRFCGAALDGEHRHPPLPGGQRCEPFALAERLASVVGGFLRGANRVRALLESTAVVSRGESERDERQ